MNCMIAFDTNVLIYSADQHDPVRRDAARTLIAGSADVVLLWQVACEFVAASRKLTGQGFTVAHSWARLSEFLAVCPLVLPTPTVLDRARVLQTEHGWSFWDAMIIAACEDAGVTRLYSEDLPGRALRGLDIINPFA
jgi:predicted nucleic acid-binding protein